MSRLEAEPSSIMSMSSMLEGSDFSEVLGSVEWGYGRYFGGQWSGVAIVGMHGLISSLRYL